MSKSTPSRFRFYDKNVFRHPLGPDTTHLKFSVNMAATYIYMDYSAMSVDYH